MILDLSQSDCPATLQTQVCIVGGGVAGQTLAGELVRAGIQVTIVESGGRDFSRDVQDMAIGENIGETYYDLRDSRLRLFGGTAAIWGGRCAELDPIDFEKRDYIPHSGWPITKTDLDPYYARVFDALGLKRAGENRLWSEIGKKQPDFDKSRLDADLWAFDEEGERFTDLARNDLDRAQILLNATVTDIQLGDQGQVLSVRVKSLSGRETLISGDTFVLANGTIEAVRLLFAAVPERPNGLGNDHDILGRFFMEHPHGRGGEIVTDKPAEVLTILPRALRVAGKRYAAYLRPAEAYQRDKRILNSSISITARRHEGQDMENYRAVTNKLKHDLPSSRFWRGLYRRGKNLAVRALELTDPWSSIWAMKAARGKTGLYAVLRAEQSPNPDSRIVLADQIDALGVRRVNLDWRLNALDQRSALELMLAVKDEFARMGLGEVKPASWMTDTSRHWKFDPLISAHAIAGYHHMGGTRMSDDPKRGVVNKDCRLHDSPNLYVASSSVFPTGGWANPTVTIMALSLRLADHIKHQVSGKAG